MALEALFQDRNVRQNLRTHIREAREIGFGECDSCGSHQSLIQAFNHDLCERCCNKIMEASYDFDKVYEEDLNEEDIEHILSEAYVIPDMNKLNADAQSKFNGSIPDLLRSYGLNPHKEWDDRLSKGWVFIRDNEISNGRTSVNQFLIDYDCSFTTPRAAQKLVPDGKTGVLAPIKVNGKAIVPSNGSQPASHSNIATQSSSHLVQKNIQAGPGIKASGTDDEFDVQITDKIKIHCKTQGQQMGNKLGFLCDTGKTSAMFIVDGKNAQDYARSIVEQLKKQPHLLFQAFEEDDVKDGYVINKYPAYSFIFDEKSFDGKNISMVLTLKDKVFEKSRVFLSDGALFKRVLLDKELREFMDGRLKKTYPMLFNGVADVKTSIGKAQTELIAVNPSDQYKLGEVVLKTELGNRDTQWKTGGERFQDKELTHNTVCDVIFGMLPKIIPGWDDPKYQSGTFANSATQSFKLEDLDDNGMKFSMVATFDLNDLYDTGSIILKMSVLDEHTGKEQPKQLTPVLYNKPGTPLKDFLERESKKIHAHYFKKSDMTETLTQSAREKMGSPAKREALFSKICQNIMDKLRFADNTKYSDISCVLDDFEVNKDGKVSSCTVRFYDEDYIAADNSVDLAKYLSVDKSFSFLKYKKADDSPRGMSEYGPSVTYTVSDMNKFSEFANLAILESLIFEAFGITHINESGRKQIYV